MTTQRELADRLPRNGRDPRMTALLAFLWLARQPGGFAAIKAGTKQQRDRLRRLAAPSRTDVAPWVRISEGRTFEVTAAGWQALNHAVGRVALEREAFDG